MESGVARSGRPQRLLADGTQIALLGQDFIASPVTSMHRTVKSTRRVRLIWPIGSTQPMTGSAADLLARPGQNRGYGGRDTGDQHDNHHAKSHVLVDIRNIRR